MKSTRLSQLMHQWREALIPALRHEVELCDKGFFFFFFLSFFFLFFFFFFFLLSFWDNLSLNLDSTIENRDYGPFLKLLGEDETIDVLITEVLSHYSSQFQSQGILTAAKTLKFFSFNLKS